MSTPVVLSGVAIETVNLLKTRLAGITEKHSRIAYRGRLQSGPPFCRTDFGAISGRRQRVPPRAGNYGYDGAV